MIGIKYIAPIFDGSGYGEASRNYILALHKAGVPITVQPHCFDRKPPPVASSKERAILDSLVNKPVDYDTVIIHLTPDMIPQHKQENPGKRIISYTVWETSKLPPLWVECLNKVDAVLVPSQWNVDSFISSGVKVPVHKVPHGIDVDTYLNVDTSGFSISGAEKTFNFYSVFQWNARKNPHGLLRAYFNAFTGNDDVRLIMKSYVNADLHPEDNLKRIRDEIVHVKGDMRFPHYPKLTLIHDNLTTEQIKSLHLTCDAYVALPHGEGWGISFAEAGLSGTPVISTNGGGQLEFLNQNNSYLVDSHLTYVSGMGNFNQWYHGDQQWFSPSTIDAAKKMREVYENFSAAKEKGQLLKKDIIENFSWDVVAKKMIECLEA